MTTPREIIAEMLVSCVRREVSGPHPEAIIEALTASGYRILSDAELAARDDAVLERAAEEADSWQGTADKLSKDREHHDRSGYHAVAADMAADIATAIRAMKGGKP